MTQVPEYILDHLRRTKELRDEIRARETTERLTDPSAGGLITGYALLAARGD